MQRRLSEVRPATLADQLLGLAKLHDSALKERWRTLYQTAPPEFTARPAGRPLCGATRTMAGSESDRHSSRTQP